MSMKESRARLAASAIPVDYFWWKGVDLKGFFARVESVGFENARVEMTTGLRENGCPEIWLRVIDTRGTEMPVVDSSTDEKGWEDFSHNCPPDCPQ